MYSFCCNTSNVKNMSIKPCYVINLIHDANTFLFTDELKKNFLQLTTFSRSVATSEPATRGKGEKLKRVRGAGQGQMLCIPAPGRSIQHSMPFSDLMCL